MGPKRVDVMDWFTVSFLLERIWFKHWWICEFSWKCVAEQWKYIREWWGILYYLYEQRDAVLKSESSCCLAKSLGWKYTLWPISVRGQISIFCKLSTLFVNGILIKQEIIIGPRNIYHRMVFSTENRGDFSVILKNFLKNILV